MPKPKSLEQLMSAHAELYKQFLPTLDGYTALAKQVLELQIEIFTLRFAKSLPGAAHIEGVLLATLSARETPAKQGELLATLEKKDVVVTHIVYDPMNFAFHLYGKA